MSKLNKGKILILILIVCSVCGVLIAKYVSQNKIYQSSGQDMLSFNPPAIYLFLDERDQDPECQVIYNLFEQKRNQLSEGIQTARLDVKGDQTLFRKFMIRVLPTVLFIDENGQVAKKIEGEGHKVEVQLKNAFDQVRDLLNL